MKNRHLRPSIRKALNHIETAAAAALAIYMFARIILLIGGVC